MRVDVILGVILLYYNDCNCCNGGEIIIIISVFFSKVVDKCNELNTLFFLLIRNRIITAKTCVGMAAVITFFRRKRKFLFICLFR